MPIFKLLLIMILCVGCKLRSEFSSTSGLTDEEIIEKYGRNDFDPSDYFIKDPAIPNQYLKDLFESRWADTRILYKDSRGWYLQNYEMHFKLAQVYTNKSEPFKSDLRYELDLFNSPNLGRFILLLAKMGYPTLRFENEIKQSLQRFIMESRNRGESQIPNPLHSSEFMQSSKRHIPFFALLSSTFFENTNEKLANVSALPSHKFVNHQNHCTALKNKLELEARFFAGLKQSQIFLTKVKPINFNKDKIQDDISKIQPLDLVLPGLARGQLDKTMQEDIAVFRGAQDNQSHASDPSQSSHDGQSKVDVKDDREYGSFDDHKIRLSLSESEYMYMEQKLKNAQEKAKSKDVNDAEQSKNESKYEANKRYQHIDLVVDPLSWMLNPFLNEGEWYCNGYDSPIILLAKNKNVDDRYQIIKELIEKNHCKQSILEKCDDYTAIVDIRVYSTSRKYL